MCENYEKKLSPIVITKLGSIEGKFVEIDANLCCEVFLGIPYAQPPINELRFEVCLIIKKIFN